MAPSIRALSSIDPRRVLTRSFAPDESPSLSMSRAERQATASGSRSSSFASRAQLLLMNLKHPSKRCQQPQVRARHQINIKSIDLFLFLFL